MTSFISRLSSFVIWLCYLFSFARFLSSWIERFSPLFELDPLFRRTFLLVVPVHVFGKIASSGAFASVEIYTTLAKVLFGKSYLVEKEVPLLRALKFRISPSWHIDKLQVADLDFISSLYVAYIIEARKHNYPLSIECNT